MSRKTASVESNEGLAAFLGNSKLTGELFAMQSCPPIGARHRSGSGNAITELGHGRFAQHAWPNSAVKRTPTLAMPSASSWPAGPCAPSLPRHRLAWASGHCTPSGLDAPRESASFHAWHLLFYATAPSRCSSSRVKSHASMCMWSTPMARPDSGSRPSCTLPHQLGCPPKQITEAQVVVQAHIKEIQDAWPHHFGG
jgi:hypothetical protein